MKICLRCGHNWKSYVEHPKKCPDCGNPYWNIPKEIRIRKLPPGIYEFCNKDTGSEGYVAYHKNKYLGLFETIDKAQETIDSFKESEKTFYKDECNSAQILIGRQVFCTNSDKFASRGIGFIGKLKDIDPNDEKPFICLVKHSKKLESFKVITGRTGTPSIHHPDYGLT